ncbi:MAG: hypothetical protein IJN46_01885 [Lachnospiraceae bacterium]|nr:hypothetical protein [Lachnospiraceae bacterium]
MRSNKCIFFLLALTVLLLSVIGVCADGQTPAVLSWPGAAELTTFDTTQQFLSDSSGLDFHNGQLYVVENDAATFWILDVAEDGTLSFAEGFEHGKTVLFPESEFGPDAEGITADDDGFLYLSSERDRIFAPKSDSIILKVDPNGSGTELTALQEWRLTDTLPTARYNMGIEAVEWVSNAHMEGRLFDQNTGAPFEATNYPDAISNGVFFVALEANGHVYAYVLNENGSSVQISDVDSQLGGAMALDYDTEKDLLWIAADDNHSNLAAVLAFRGTQTPLLAHVSPPVSVDPKRNTEGFAIAPSRYAKNGQIPVYRLCDGVRSGALTIGCLASDFDPFRENAAAGQYDPAAGDVALTKLPASAVQILAGYDISGQMRFSRVYRDLSGDLRLRIPEAADCAALTLYLLDETHTPMAPAVAISILPQ